MADRSALIKVTNTIGSVINPATQEGLDAVVTALGNINVTVKYDSRFDNGATYMYIGEAVPGTSDSSASWRIKRYVQSDLRGTWADGTANFTKVWDNRTTYNY